jgi:peptide chain release factor 3
MPATRRSTAPVSSSSSRKASSRRSSPQRPPGATLLAAVGPLQFEVVQYRLQVGVQRRIPPRRPRPGRCSWLEPHPSLQDTSRLIVANGVSFGVDKFDQPVVLFPNEWTMRYFIEKNPELKLHELPIEQTRT